MRALEQSGVIRDYPAHIDPAKVGLTFSAITFATLREGSRNAVQSFEAALLDVPEVVRAQRLFGDPDDMLHVLRLDLPAFQELYDERRTSVVQDRPLPCRNQSACAL